MKDTMVVLNGCTFGTAMKRVRRTFPMDSFILLDQQDGTTLAVRHDVAVQRGIDKRAKALPKPAIYFHSFQEMVGEALRRGFTHISVNDGDGWTSRLPIVDMSRGYIPRFWGDYKWRFYRTANSHWMESMTLYPSANQIFYHVKELF